MAQNQGQFIASKDLAKLLELSDKTTRKYVNEVANEIEDYGESIEVKRGRGYRLISKTSENLQSYVNYLSSHSLENTSFLLYLIRRLFSDGRLTIKELSETFFMSKTTARQELSDFEESLALYHLKLKRSENTYQLEGSEDKKRNFLVSYLEKISEEEDIETLINTYLPRKVYSSEIMFSLIELSKKYDIEFIDYALDSLVTYIELSLLRIEQNYTIKDFDLPKALKGTKYVRAAEEFCRSLEEKFNFTFPEDEIHYLALNFSLKSTYDDELSKGGISEEDLKQLLMTLKEKEKIKLEVSDQILYSLRKHLNSLFFRLENDSFIRNPLLGEIKSKYLAEFNLTKKYFGQLPQLKGHDLPDEEWGFVVLYILASEENYKANHVVHVVLVRATGVASAEFLKSRLLKEFQNQIEIVDTISLLQLEGYEFKDIDFIISSISLKNIILPVPVISVGIVLSDWDIKQIKTYLSNFKENSGYDSELDFDSELIEKLIPDEHYLYVEEKTTKDKIITQILYQLDYLDTRGFIFRMKNYLKMREKYGSVVFAPHVAIPHPIKPVGEEDDIVVAQLREGIKWDEDHEDIRLIILISPTRHANGKLEDFIQAIIEILDHEESLNELLTLHDAKTFKKFILAEIKNLKIKEKEK